MITQGSAQERERALTDSGRAGDKVAAPDPATAPHGVDAESGGAATSAQAVNEDAARRRALGKRVAGVEMSSSNRPDHGGRGRAAVLLWGVLAGGVVLGIALALAGL